MEGKRAAEPGDLLRLLPIGEPTFSPDGSQVAYVVQSLDDSADEVHSDIWVAQAGGGTPRRLTAGGARSSSPCWSPDGKQIAFLSNRGGHSQIWLMGVADGEARAIETEQHPEAGLGWSPGGESLVYTARLFSQADEWEPYPGAPAGDRGRAQGQAAGEPGHGDTKVITRLHHKLDGVGYFGDGNVQVFTVAARPGAAQARQITSGPFDHTDPAWSPDGRRLVFVADRSGAESVRDGVWDGKALWSIALEAGELTRLTALEGPINGPVFSPDGQAIAFFGHQAKFQAATFSQLWVFRDGALTCVTAELDRYIGTPAYADARYNHGITPLWPRWSGDGRMVYVQAGFGGDCPVCTVEVASGRLERVTPGDGRTVASFNVRPDGVIAYVAGATGAPDELYLFEPATGEERQITDHNAALTAAVAFTRGELVRFPGADGWQIEGWLYRPAGFQPGRPVPLVLIVHGGPHFAFGEILSLEVQVLLGAGCAVLTVNPRGSGGYTQAFAHGCIGDWGGKDFVDLMAGVDHVVAMGVADPERLGIMGWSYGGYMSSWTITQTNRFRAALIGACVSNRFSFAGTSDVPWFMVSSAGGEPWDPAGVAKLLERSAISGVRRVETPALLIHPEGDLRCPVEQSEQLFTHLRRQGKEAYLVRYPGEFHMLEKPSHRIDYYRRVQSWFGHRLAQ